MRSSGRVRINGGSTRSVRSKDLEQVCVDEKKVHIEKDGFYVKEETDEQD